jgi:hypothetical protein
LVLKRLLAAVAVLLAIVAPVRAQNPPANTSGALTATGSVTLTTSGYGSVAIQITGSFVATVTFEGSVDASTYASLLCSAIASGSTVTSASATGVWICSTGGLKSVRGRVSAYTSGTVTIALQAAPAGGGGGGGGGSSGAVNIADPSTPSQKAAVNASGQLSITCANCSGSGASAVDESTFTQGTNSIAPSGGLFTNSYSALSSGQAGVAQITSDGAFFVNHTKIGGTAVDTNSGNKSAGTQRFVLATDQPQLTNALKVDPSAVTSPVSVSSLPLPSGASTSAKQPALGTAGSASTDVLTIQGIASMTKLLVTPDLPSGAATSTKQSDGSQKTQIVDGSGNVIASTSNNLNVQCANCSGSGASAADEASFTAGTSTFAPFGGFFQTTATSNALTNGQQGLAQMTAQRALFANLRNASGTEVGTSTTPLQVTLANTGANATAVKVDGSAVTQPVSIADGSDTTLGARADAKSTATDTTAVSAMSVLKQISASVQAPPSQAVTNAGTFAVQNTQQGTASQNVAQLAGTTTDTNSGTKSAGTLRVVLATDQPQLTNKLLVTPDSVALPANQSVNVSQMNGATTSMNAGSPDSGTQRVVLADGALECVIVSAASTNSNNCKGSAGQFFGYDLYNTTTTTYYLRLYNTSSAPTCSSSTGFIRSIPIPPAAASGQVGGGIRVMPVGVSYGTGLSYCLTGGSSSTDNTNAATGVFGTVVYR